MQKMHITFFKFSFVKGILNVSCNNGLVFFEQSGHLRLREPHGLVFEFDIDVCLAIGGLIEDDLSPGAVL